MACSTRTPTVDAFLARTLQVVAAGGRAADSSKTPIGCAVSVNCAGSAVAASRAGSAAVYVAFIRVSYAVAADTRRTHSAAVDADFAGVQDAVTAVAR